MVRLSRVVKRRRDNVCRVSVKRSFRGEPPFR